MEQKLIVGVDIAKQMFTVATSWAGQVTYLGEFVNTAAGCEAMAETLVAEAVRVRAGGGIHLIIEPTGGYEATWMAIAYENEWAVTRVNPGAVRTWGKGRGFRSKTDRRDAMLLAQFGAETNPPAQAPLAEEVAELDALLRRKTDLEQLLRSERNRKEHLAALPRPTPAVTESLQRTIDALEKELKAINDAIEALFERQPVLALQRRQLLTLPGVGKAIVPYLLVDLHRFQARTQGQGNHKQWVAFLGLDPALFESGASVRHRPTISRQGDEVMRTKLYLGALGGIRGANPLKAFYDSLCARDKPAKLALVACARKIAVWAWAIFTTGTTFEASRFNSKPARA